MNFAKFLIVLAIIVVIGGLGFYQLSFKKSQIPAPSTSSNHTLSPSSTPYPNTQSAVEAFLAKKYNKPVFEVKVVVNKEVPGFASGTVTFGQGGPGEVGAWLAVLGNGWDVVWDGNGNVDCTKMRTQYGFPDTILKPNYCN